MTWHQGFLHFYHDLDFDQLHVRRPSRFIFLCGGVVGPAGRTAPSLRHLLLNDLRFEAKLAAKVVLAEQANQLYRDSGYRDLITFEEDIAKISALVLLIAESAGSLTELGAFATNDTIRKSLAVIIQHKHADAESFIRYGPIEKILNEHDDRVIVYPWKTTALGTIVKSSFRPHATRARKYINGLVLKTPKEELFKNDEALQTFILILWMLYLGWAMSRAELLVIMRAINRPMTDVELKGKLFCMKTAGWIASYPYENKTYWYFDGSDDPISRYSFKRHARTRDAVRSKSSAIQSLLKGLRIPKHVMQIVADARARALPK